MFEVIKSVINAGGFRLSDMQFKIKKLYLLGDLSEEQADMLLAMASGGVSPDAERPDTLEMLKKLSGRMDALEARMDALTGETPEADGHPAWEPWDGVSDRYQPGAVVVHNGKLWESVYAGQNVWEPGIGEAFWKEYTA